MSSLNVAKDCFDYKFKMNQIICINQIELGKTLPTAFLDPKQREHIPDLSTTDNHWILVILLILMEENKRRVKGRNSVYPFSVQFDQVVYEIKFIIEFTKQFDSLILCYSSVQVISARKGEFETGFERGGQTREHAMLVKTAGVRKLVVAVNKMDDSTVSWNETRSERLALYVNYETFR